MKNKTILHDILLIGTLLIVSLVLFVIQRGQREKASFAVVSVNGVETGRYPLKQDGVFSLNGGSNILVIKDETAYLEDANCPDKLCVKQGKVKYCGQCITCLPNKLTVTLYGGDKSVDLVL